jgi:hypothetical protein
MENLLLVFQAFHGPSFPHHAQRCYCAAMVLVSDMRVFRPRCCSPGLCPLAGDIYMGFSDSPAIEGSAYDHR